ncbi:MAG: Nif3-like dinuclear metal center hexameric protein [Planctomycetaceae bacterium]|nr:Nif3-like dinuclear metal center hexameric protein [Planctomycetaceae bacterium]
MTRLSEIVEFLEAFAPLDLAEDWDNVGLLVGDLDDEVSRAMTCLTLTPDVAEEAISRGVQLIVSHHPILFRGVQRITSETSEGRMLLNLLAARVAVFSPHTAFDSAADGINRKLAESLGLTNIDALRPIAPAEGHAIEDGLRVVPSGHTPVGSGRFGQLPHPMSLADFNDRVKTALGIPYLQYVGAETKTINHVAVACGSAAEFLPDAQRHGCDVLVTGEARFHACLEAKASGIAMVLAGHFATERPAVEQLADRLSSQFADLNCCASEVERDPVQWSLS